MSDSEQRAEQESPPIAVERPSGWFAFNDKPVLLQFREPYFGMDYSTYQPIMKEGGAVATPVLSGILHVEPDGCGGVMLILERPVGRGSDTLLVAVKPADIVYCTHVHESKIITQ